MGITECSKTDLAALDFDGRIVDGDERNGIYITGHGMLIFEVGTEKFAQM